ncbi:P-loop containing nucleoside triphosphate hydrolase protein [Lipomyces tetrasporus]|uniref:P-loop containing nucleoside triphosphate hydrolase protein n=1 Tax=Lipomyces tetrasporus TaxID=54092 RepID=A0AAD7QXN8_9ASCO|nr:P-loop containing nucleoside triphosphate hydrolase protein [Lipomyces tetrasporus]KAJ8103305.1 P-loop containing nucleoside triphosphate hydrolase protein [Lipomyces tetrasporus]
MGRKGFVGSKYFDEADKLKTGPGAKKGLTTWTDYVKYFVRFFPYVWPYDDRKLQLNIVLCMLIIVLQRVVNILVPYQLGKVTDQLSTESGKLAIPWGRIALYLCLRYMQGSGSILGFVQGRLWMAVSQYSYRSLSVLGFEHVLGLGLDFHLSQRSSEIISTLDKGHAITSFVEKITFQLIPMFIDMTLAIGFFVVTMDRFYATFVICVATTYVWASTQLSRKRVENKRNLVRNSIAEYGIKVDSITAYETVKYFSAKDYEMERYINAIEATQAAELKYQLSHHLVNLVQNSIFTVGLLFSCVFSAYQVSKGIQMVGTFVSLLTYMAQLQHPLDQFTNFLRSTQDNLISAERMISLLEQKPTVADKPGANELKVPRGVISFNNVSFRYDEQHKPAIHNLTLKCPAGSTVAFVGESGGGKSTIFRLLFRFYDVSSGSIAIDGQDIRDITLKSLGKNVGVVPQECALFNDTVMFNLKYAKRDATDEEVYAATRAASIHDKILKFPDGYKTLVGERGLRLSGGEKQRLAIARAILKNPAILLLDEATAMLDVDSERHIQTALHELSRNRTTLVIAHRLSTIISADKIVVVHEGLVVEQGSHAELLTLKGRYYGMWEKQVSPTFAEETSDEEVQEKNRKPVKPKNKDLKQAVFINDLDLQKM